MLLPDVSAPRYSALIRGRMISLTAALCRANNGAAGTEIGQNGAHQPRPDQTPVPWRIGEVIDLEEQYDPTASAYRPVLCVERPMTGDPWPARLFLHDLTRSWGFAKLSAVFQAGVSVFYRSAERASLHEQVYARKLATLDRLRTPRSLPG